MSLIKHGPFAHFDCGDDCDEAQQPEHVTPSDDYPFCPGCEWEIARQCTIEGCHNTTQHPGQPCEHCHKEIGAGG